MIKLTNDEMQTALKLRQLKKEAGSRSPSVFTILEKLPEIKINVDACFLSNPYATDLFLEYLQQELIETKKFRDVLQFYPSQNRVIAETLSKNINTDKKNIFVGNGAIEIIQAIMHNFVEKKVIINIPTFSSYYEFAKENTEIVYHQLRKENDYLLETDRYLEFVKREKPDSVIIINPNNPNGGYLPCEDLRYILMNLKEIKNIIIDESFIHFAYEDNDYSLISYTKLFHEFSNVIVIKSMSKDFGIAGIRAGYAIMDAEKVSGLVKNGFLWNSGGLAEYFFRLYTRENFFIKYEAVRKKYISEVQSFFKELSAIPRIKVYPSMANFALIELRDGSTADDFVLKLLIKHGVYTRTGSDKIGIDGQAIRIAGRSKEENKIIIESIKNIMNNN